MGAETSGTGPFSQPDTTAPTLFIDAGSSEAFPDTCHQLIPYFAVGIEPLLAAASIRGRIYRRPIFHIGGHLVGQFQSLVVRRRRERDDQIEVQSFQVFQLL